jgi:amino acid adenylation domain-containing protein
MQDIANIACAVYRHSLEQPDSPALVFQNERTSYADLVRAAAHLAHGLQTAPTWPSHAIRPPRVGILGSRSRDALTAMLGACWAGASYVPIGLKLPQERMLAILAQCQLDALIVAKDAIQLLTPQLLHACPPLLICQGDAPASSPPPERPGQHILQACALPAMEPAEPVAMEAQDPAYIIFTSGTTGVPKGVMVSVASARHYAASIARTLELRADDRALETCELSFDFSVHNMYATWEAGAALYLLPATQVMNAVKFARANALTVWNSVPSLAGMLAQLKTLAPGSLPSLRLTVFGGEQLPESTVHTWHSAAPHSAIVNLYGPTEATVFCMIQREPFVVTEGRGVVAIGQVLPGCSAAVLDDAGQPLAPGQPGELAIGGVQLALGYLDAPELTAQRFPRHGGARWYRTGDLAMCDAQGVFHCLGRIDNQVKIMGYRVELEEIEAHLRAASGVELVAAVAWPVVDGIAKGSVGFVGVSASQSIDQAAVITRMKQSLPAYMVPNRIVALEAMPLNASGKVDRRALLAQLQDGVT